MFGKINMNKETKTKSFSLFVFREMKVIDNQRILNQLSNKLEPRQS